MFKKRDRNDRYNNFIIDYDKGINSWKFCSLLDAFAQFKDIPKNKIKKELGSKFETQIFEFIKQNANSVVQFAYPDMQKISTEAQDVINKSKESPDKVFYLQRENDPDMYIYKGQRILFYSDRLMNIDGEVVTGELISDLWDDVLPNDLHNEGGVTLKKGKKPEKMLKRIIEIATNPNDLVLDFFSGSGTSSAVAHKMNRRWIAIEQMDYIRDLPEARIRKVIEGEQSGISKSVNW